MVLKTKLEWYLQNDLSSFEYEQHYYVVSEINEDLKLVFATNDLFASDGNKVGFYSKKKQGFIFLFKIGNWAEYVAPLDESALYNVHDYFSLKRDLATAVRSEFLDAAIFEAKRTIKNDKCDAEYLRKVNERAKDCFITGKTLRANNMTNIKINSFTEKQLLSALVDFYDTAYDIAEEMLEKDEEYSYDYFFLQDVNERVKELKKSNQTTELAANARIQTIIHSSKYKHVQVILSNYKQCTELITLNVDTCYLGYIPICAIEKIMWRRTPIYEKKDYMIHDLTKEEWLNQNGSQYAKFQAFDFVPSSFFKDTDFSVSLIHKGFSFGKLPSFLLEDKAFVLKVLRSETAQKNRLFYTFLSESFKLDKDILHEMMKDSSFFAVSELPLDAYKMDDLIMPMLKEFDIANLNVVAAYNPSFFDNETVMDTFKQSFSSSIKTALSETIIEKLNDLDFVIKLLENQNISLVNIHALSEKMLNEEVLWNVLEKKSVPKFTHIQTDVIFEKLNQSNRHNLTIMSTLVSWMRMSRIKTFIKSSFGLDTFHNWKAFQIVCVEQDNSILQIVSEDVKQDAIRMICKKNPYYLTRNESLWWKTYDKDFILELVHINPDVLSTIHSQYPLDVLKALFEEDTDYVSKLDWLAYENEDVLNLASDYASILPKLRLTSFDSKHKDLILKCLKHNFNDFSYIPKGYAKTNYQTILESKEFLIDAFKLNISDKERENAFIYLLDMKSHAVKDLDVLSIILSDDFSLLEYCKRSIYNDKDLMMNVIPKTKTSKAMVRTILENLNSKLIKDKDILALL